MILPVGFELPRIRRMLESSAYLEAGYWTALILLICFVLPEVSVPGRTCCKEAAVGYAMSGAAVYLAARFLLGALLQGLAASPYDLSPMGIVYNVLTMFPIRIARELVRAYLIGVILLDVRREWRKVTLMMLTVLYAVLEMNLRKISRLDGTEACFIYAVTDIIPALAEQALCTILVLGGGARAGIVYNCLTAGFWRFFPLLPELPWLAESAVGILFPVLYAAHIHEQSQLFDGKASLREEEPAGGYALSLGLAVAFSWFCVGVFPVYPSVILTGSMEPRIRPGDVVLIRKLQEERELYDLQAGTIINFKRDDISITHRIEQVILDEAGNVSFQTKGDNNDAVDGQIVQASEVNGTITGVIPKAGVAVLLMQGSENIPEGVVDDEP